VTLAVTTYQWYLMVHILTAVIWVGGSLVTQFFAFRILQTNDPVRMAGFSKDVEWIGTRLFMPSSLLLLVFGFLLVHEADWGYPFWVIFGLAVFGVSFVMGAGFFGPESGRIGKLIDAQGAESPEVQRRIKRILLFSRFELLLLILVVIDMTIKPFS
jgi:uncharacterized membrane protein